MVGRTFRGFWPNPLLRRDFRGPSKGFTSLLSGVVTETFLSSLALVHVFPSLPSGVVTETELERTRVYGARSVAW
ncbi:MAG: hypothetical protein D084_Lepto4C00626G0006 [Leptospirillum sp. Group IV 'UBA BS']|nr:MAG: hypothetical protein D084_Lepto4C00626G0006 [Leptospirillum sp. Group IV 'UBA BS']